MSVGAEVEVEKGRPSDAAYRTPRGEIVRRRSAPGQRLAGRRLAQDMGFGLSPEGAAPLRGYDG